MEGSDREDETGLDYFFGKGMKIMKIAFWSNTHGLCCNTTQLGIISIWYALQRPDAHCVIMENHKNLFGISRMLYRPIASESQIYYRYGGLGTLMRHLGKGDMSLLEMEFMAERFVGERLMYFPIGADMGPEQLDYYLERDLRRLFLLLDKRIDHTWIDTSPSACTTRAILNAADGVVVSLSQNRIVLDNLFSNHRELHKKAFYIIGNYEADSDLTKDEIVSLYGLSNDRVAVIPHDAGMMDAISKGTLIPYIMQAFHCEVHKKGFEMARALRDAMDAFFCWLGDEEETHIDEKGVSGYPAMVAEGNIKRYPSFVAENGVNRYNVHPGNRFCNSRESIGMQQG